MIVVIVDSAPGKAVSAGGSAEIGGDVSIMFFVITFYISFYYFKLFIYIS